MSSNHLHHNRTLRLLQFHDIGSKSNEKVSTAPSRVSKKGGAYRFPTQARKKSEVFKRYRDVSVRQARRIPVCEVNIVINNLMILVNAVQELNARVLTLVFSLMTACVMNIAVTLLLAPNSALIHRATGKESKQVTSVLS